MSDHSVLLVHATREGQTAKVARRIGAVLSGHGLGVREIDARDVDATRSVSLEKFDLLVCGASMHAGGIEREMVDFLRTHRETIAAMPRSLFLVLLSAATRDPVLKEKWLADARRKLESQLPVPFDPPEMIAGALTYSKYSLPMRWMMRRIAAKAGGDTDTSRDYEYTDWEQVEDYARRLLERLVR